MSELELKKISEEYVMPLKKDTLKSDVRDMCDIILRHRDFLLFYWMIDPITYSNGDLHYDFFNEYTKNDNDLQIK